MISSLVNEIEWLWPWATLVVPLPFLYRWLRSPQSSAVIAPVIPLFKAIESLGIGTGGSDNSASKMVRLLALLSWLLVVAALSRPILYGNKIELPLSGRDLMLAVDISPSMRQQDMALNGFRKTRLEVVKKVVSDFVSVREGDRIGLILFGTQPYIQAPLSFDVDTIDTLLQEAFLGMAGQSTAIGDAIGLGVKRLRERPEQSRVLVLITDGANSAGEIQPEKAAQLAAQESIKIYTIGMGADEATRSSLFGQMTYNPSSDLDEASLKSIAEITGGAYFRARNTPELELIYEQINQLEPVEQEKRIFRPTKSISHWFICVSILLFSVAMLLSKRPRRLRGGS